MLQTGRAYSVGSGYRYGFNGKENDNEVKGNGNQQDYGMRIYDTRLGKFLSVDPLSSKYPQLTPYQFASCSPISGIDLDGGEFKYYNRERIINENGNEKLKLTDVYAVDIGIITINLVVPPLVNFDPIDIPGPYTLTPKPLTFSFSFSLEDLGISARVVNIDGTDRVVPNGYLNRQDLPAYGDPIWETFETKEQFATRLTRNIDKIIQTAEDIRDIKSLLTTSLPLLTKSKGLPKLKYQLGKNDLDWRGTGSKFKDALDEAFKKTGVDRKKFKVSKWGKDKYGKSIPVEYKGPKGAKVSVDYPHGVDGPDAPHIGWQTPGKRTVGGQRGHIILDDVPSGR